MTLTFAQELSPIYVKDLNQNKRVKSEEISKAKISGDTLKLLEMNPSLSRQGAGGISSLPVVHGMSSDRISVKIDGGQITASCPNHMNPALSYIDSTKVEDIELIAGITPVSHGGDSIGGSIIVNSKKPEFSDKGAAHRMNITQTYRSVNENFSTALRYQFANENWSLLYSGLEEKAENYKNGKGERLKGTRYNQNNQSLTFARKIDDGAVSLKLNHANIPYQGFPNQYMDLLGNTSNGLNLNYTKMHGDALVDLALFHQHINHYMNKLHPDRMGNMPMYIRSDETGYNLKIDFELNAKSKLKIGNELVLYRLDDWWPPISNTPNGGMSPNEFQNINKGKRDRLAFFIETENKWSDFYHTNLGIRTDIVRMDTGEVSGYSSVNSDVDADFFNARDREKTDHNIDATLSNDFHFSDIFSMQIGLARKTRSPNMYERYAWAGSSPADISGNGAVKMDMRMINWFGDGNGYVGNVDLKPEIAHTLSASFIFTDKDQEKFKLNFTPYYTDVKDFIDADLLVQDNAKNINYLQFANHDAIILGLDMALSAKLNKNLTLNLIGNYTRGYRQDGMSDLYHQMPLNGKIGLEYQREKWTGDILVHLVSKKTRVSKLRLESETAGYALLDIGASYQVLKRLKLDLHISNLLDHNYQQALGGVDIINHGTITRSWMEGMGRSVNLGISLDI